MHWDFALILIFLGGAVPLLGRRCIRQLMAMPETTKRDRLSLYASTITFQWLASAVALWRATAHGISAAELGLAVPNLALTLVIAFVLGAFVFANQVFSLRRLALRPEEIKGTLPQLALKIFPQDNVERLVFFALVVTVAVCEELIYRGFAQRVFENWSGSYVAAGIAGSAALFGLAHLYQGRRGLAATFVVGLIFSGVRSWTGSLLAPLIAHFVTDMTAGLLAPPRLKQALSRSATETSHSESVA